MTRRSYLFRNGEENVKQFQRSGRFYTRMGHWYFKTREGIDYGPYESRTECRYAYNEFIDVVSNQSDLSAAPLDYQPSANGWKLPKINLG